MFNSTDFREELRRIFHLVFPIIGTQLSLVLISMTDNMMVGHIDSLMLSIFAIATGISSIGAIITVGVSASLSILVARSYGENNPSKMTYWMHQGLYVNGFLIFIFFNLFYFNSFFLSSLFEKMPLIKDNPQALLILGDYLKIYSFSYIGIIFFNYYRAFLEPQKKTAIITKVVVFSLPINVLLNYLFIYGYGVIPAMGILGCAISTVIVHALKFIFLTWYCKRDEELSSLFSRPIPFHFQSVRQIFFLGIPIASVVFFEAMSIVLIPIFINSYGKEYVAATQVILNSARFLVQIPIALTMSYSIRMSTLVGEGKIKDILSLTPFYLKVAMGVGLGNSILYLLFSKLVIHAYTDEAMVISIAMMMAIVVNIYQIPDSIQSALNGILRGLKDVKGSLYILLFSYWLVGIPLGYLFCYGSGIIPSYGPIAFFWSLLSSMLLCSFLYYIRLKWLLKNKSMLD